MRWFLFALVAVFGLVVLVMAARAGGLSWLGADKNPARNTLLAIGVVLSSIVALVTVLAAIRKLMAGPEEPPLDELTTRLATAMQVQWDRAARDRRVIEPRALPIRWRLSVRALAGPPGAATLVGDGTAPFPPLPGLTHVTPDQLAEGTRQGLHDVYGGLASGRLVITGVAGSGKSSAAVLLLLDALTYREQAATDDDRRRIPIPVMFTLQGWDPETVDLDTWLITKLTEIPPFRGRNGADEARHMLDAGRISVFLDGLDEIGKELRPIAIDKLSAQANFRLVLLTRPDELVDIAGKGHLLVGAAALELQPISGSDAAEYLLRPLVAPTPAGWRALTEALAASDDLPVTEALCNPLMITLVRDAYPTGKDVEELLDKTKFPTVTELENHLLDLAVQTAYTPRPGYPAPPYTLDMARYTLAYIARHLERTGTRDLAWWKIAKWAPRLPQRAVGGFICSAALCPVLYPAIANGGVSEIIAFGYLLVAAFVGAPLLELVRPVRTVAFWRRSELVRQRLMSKLLKRMLLGFFCAFLAGIAMIMMLAVFMGDFSGAFKAGCQLGIVFGIAAAFGYAPISLVRNQM